MLRSAWLAVFFVLVPALIVLQAAVRNRLMLSKRDRPKSRTLDIPLSPAQAIYHQAEFSSIKTEIAELVKTIASNFQYAVIGSAGVFTWITAAETVMGHKPLISINPEYIEYTLWLPFMLSGLFCSLSAGLYVRLTEMAKYLWRLEDVMGSGELGWERMFYGHPGTLGPIYLYGWLLLLAGDFLLAFYLPLPSTLP